jgi:hypothetical protein
MTRHTARFPSQPTGPALTDGEWTETPHYFDFWLFGEKWRGIGERLHKGYLVSIQGRLEQDTWEQDGLSDPAPSENPEALEIGQEGA